MLQDRVALAGVTSVRQSQFAAPGVRETVLQLRVSAKRPVRHVHTGPFLRSKVLVGRDGRLRGEGVRRHSQKDLGLFILKTGNRDHVLQSNLGDELNVGSALGLGGTMREKVGKQLFT